MQHVIGVHNYVTSFACIFPIQLQMRNLCCVWTFAWFDLITGYVAAMALALLALRRHKLFGLSWQVLLCRRSIGS